MNELRATACALARGAGEILKSFFAHDLEVNHKGVVDLVTEADRRSEAFITEALAKQHPQHGILAEESGQTAHQGALRWVIDPLDGTVNFAHQNPHWCVLIALQEHTPAGYVTCLGVTYDPLRNEEFVAVRGGGATLNGQPIQVSKQSRLLDTLSATGFGYNRLFTAQDNHAEFCRLNLLTQGVRRFGSAGLDLAYVACGRLDFYWEYNLNPWDMAPGALLVAEARGQVTDLQGERLLPDAGTLLASNVQVHAAVLAALSSTAGHPINSRAGLEDHLPRDLVERLRTAWPPGGTASP